MNRKTALVLSALIAAVLVVVAAERVMAASQAPEPVAQDTSDEDNPHAEFDQLVGPFESGPEVTAACLDCHSGEADEVMMTSHWTWEYDNAETGETVGKNNVINNYCVSTRENYPRCTSCHAGYGWRDETFFETATEEQVDCLVCHDTTGTYKKFPTAAGFTVQGEAVEFGGKTWEPVDLAAVAQNVGEPSRATCGACHFTGGGGDGVKHGDLDNTMLTPSYELDVHMSPDGADMTCQECHVTEDHVISGGRYVMDWATDEPVNTCESCHSAEPHEELEDADTIAALNRHAETLACQTCHIPEFARGEPTMMTWDWSTAGEKNDEGGLLILSEDINGFERHVYDTRKGTFEWAMNVQPTYMWSNGVFDYSLMDEGVTPGEVWVINQPLGDINDENAKIWPMKQFQGLQPYDTENNQIGAINLFPFPGDEDTEAFWRAYDWDAALEVGMAAYGVEYSGSYDFTESVMYWPITHQVAPAANAVQCDSCHGPEADRIDFVALGYAETDVERLTQFPPLTAEEVAEAEAAAAEATAQVEADATAAAEEAAAEEAAAATAEAEAAAEEAAADEAADDVAEEPAETDAGGISPTVIIIGVVVLAAVIGGVVLLQRQQAAA